MEMWSVGESGFLCASSIRQEINEVYVSCIAITPILKSNHVVRYRNRAEDVEYPGLAKNFQIIRHFVIFFVTRLLKLRFRVKWTLHK